MHPLQSLAASLLLSLVFTLLFSRTGGLLSHRNSLTHRFPRFLPRNLFPRHTRCVFSHLNCNGHSFLLISHLSRISRIENPSCSACEHSFHNTSHLILHCPATNSLRCSFFGHYLSLYDFWFRPWGVAQLVGLHGLPPFPHPSEGVGKQQQRLHQGLRLCLASRSFHKLVTLYLCVLMRPSKESF